MNAIIGMFSDSMVHCLNWLHAFWEAVGAKPLFIMAFSLVIATGAIIRPVLRGAVGSSDRAKKRESK